ncbi:MAG: hypothetical protein RXP28_08520 [Nitrososphaeria archaeon]
MRQKVVRVLPKVFVRERKVVEEFKGSNPDLYCFKDELLLEDIKSLCP